MGWCCGKPKPKAQQPTIKKEEPKPVKAEEPKPETRQVVNKNQPTKEAVKKKGAAEEKQVKVKEEDEFTDLQKLLKENKIDDNPKINNKYTMFFDPSTNSKGVSNFMKSAKGMKIDKLKKFSMIYVKEMDKDGYSNMADFINNSQLSHLDYLYLHGGDKAKFSSLDKAALKNLMRIVANQVYIDTFTLDEADVKLIFENCSKAKELWLVNWKITGIGNKFEINLKSVPSVQTLDLYYTLMEDSKEYLTELKFRELLDAISKSSFKTSLKKIHYHEFDYSKTDLEDIIKGYGLNIRIIGDEKEPKPLD